MLAKSVIEPWCLASDFNSIIDPSKQEGGATSVKGGCHTFQNFLFENSLRDLGCCGPRLTWKEVIFHNIWIELFAIRNGIHLCLIARLKTCTI